MKKTLEKTLRGLIRSVSIIALVISWMTVKWIAVIMKLMSTALSILNDVFRIVSSNLCNKMDRQINSFKKFNL